MELGGQRVTGLAGFQGLLVVAAGPGPLGPVGGHAQPEREQGTAKPGSAPATSSPSATASPASAGRPSSRASSAVATNREVANHGWVTVWA